MLPHRLEHAADLSVNSVAGSSSSSWTPARGVTGLRMAHRSGSTPPMVALAPPVLLGHEVRMALGGRGSFGGANHA